VTSQAACQTACAGYSRWHYQPGTSACEGPDGTLLVTRERDVNDLDDDGDVDEIIRWRYVVVISECRVRADGVCEEHHQLYRCWSDADHPCDAPEAIGPDYWVPIGSGCQCVQAFGYPGCSTVAFHYHWYCRSSLYTTYYATGDPGDTAIPLDPWNEAGPHGVPFPTDEGASVWLGRPNLFVSTNEKQWTIELLGASADKYGIVSVAGYKPTDPPTQVPVAAVTGVVTDPGPPKKRTFTITLRPQPEWEKAELQRTDQGSDGPIYLRVRSYSHCSHVVAVGDRLDIQEGRFGVSDQDDYRITAITVFPEGVPVMDGGDHGIVAPTETGAWFDEPVWIDPDGEPRPEGGIRFFTEGPGLTPEHLYSLWLTMGGPAPEAYSMYAFDAGAGVHQYYRLVPEEIVGVPGG